MESMSCFSAGKSLFDTSIVFFLFLAASPRVHPGIYITPSVPRLPGIVVLLNTFLAYTVALLAPL
jgi:hypothetical protein